MATLPSIAMIPSGYKANKVYSVLPTDGSGDLDFARTSTATRINSGGLVKEVLTGVPRLDYTDGVCPSLLLEPTSINRVINSAEGVKVSLPTSSTNTISPDGTNNAYIPLPNSTSNRYEQSIPSGTYATGQKLTYSWYRKRISTPTGDAVGDLDIKQLVNLTELEVSNARQIETNINGFDRFEAVVQVIDGSLSSTFRAYFGSVVGVGNSSVAYWGHQFEALDYATSLIITTGTTITRTAETASKSGISSLINSSEGVFYTNIKMPLSIVQNHWLTISDGTNQNSIGIVFESNAKTTTRVEVAGATQFYETHTSDYSIYQKVAISWKLNEFKMFLNGVQIGSTDTTGLVPSVGSLSQFQFAYSTNSSNFTFGECKDLRVFKTALTDSELTTLTTL